MDVLTTDFNYVYPGKLATELFYKPSVTNPGITSLFRVIPNVKGKMQLSIPNNLRNIVRSYSGCDMPETGTATVSNRTMETCPMYFHVTECEAAFKDTYLEEQIPYGLDALGLGAYIVGIVETLLVDALSHDNFRVFSFSKASDPDDDWKQCDGLFTKLIAGNLATEVIKVDDITTLNQTVGTRALDYLENLYIGAAITLKQTARNLKAFYVTGNIYENLLKTYEGIEAQGGLTQFAIEGQVQLRYRGIEILEIYAWDEALLVPENPYFGVFNTAIVYCAKDSNVIGVGRESDMGEVRQYYGAWDHKIHWEGMFNMGYQYVHGELVAFSLGQVV